MYCLYDEEIGYFQGMNLLVGNIILHMKEVDKTFFFLREIMGRAGLRVLYRQNFNQVLKESDIFLHQHLKEKMPELYEHLVLQSIILDGRANLINDICSFFHEYVWVCN
jgi:hypothetical protein